MKKLVLFSIAALVAAFALGQVVHDGSDGSEADPAFVAWLDDPVAPNGLTSANGSLNKIKFPTSTNGLSSGDLWNSNGVPAFVP